MYTLFAEGNSVFNTEAERNFVQVNYEKAENISIDFAIMEKATNVQVKKGKFRLE